MDIYGRFRPKASEKELLFAGRIFVLALVGISIAWIPIINASQGSQLFVYIQSISSYLGPPICATFVLGMFWTRTNEPGAFWGLMAGLIVGLTRFFLEFYYQAPPCGSNDPHPPEWWYRWVKDIHYLHFAIILFLISGLVTIIISLITPPIPEEYLYRLTFWSKHSTKVMIDLDSDTQYSAEEEKLSINQHEPRSDLDKVREAAEFLDEPKGPKKLVNTNAVIILMLTCFIWGYFA